MKPRIAIPISTTNDQEYNQRSWPMYAAAVERSGGEAIQVPLGLAAAELHSLADSCQGFCLPGSPADVNPAYYGAEVDPATSPADPAREACDFTLLEHAEKYGKPVLAICFGCQSLNAWRGGTLVQDLMPVPVNHSAGSSVAVAHAVLVPIASQLGKLLGAEADVLQEAPVQDSFLRLPVNTSHHQAVGTPGDGLRIVGRCADDGVVEALENDPDYRTSDGSPAGDQLLFGIQWHPERSFDISPASRALFGALVTAAAAHRLAEAAE